MATPAFSRFAGASRAAGTKVAHGSRLTASWIRRAVRHGAGESGLAGLFEVHAIHSAGDAVLAVALAGTLFFGVPVGQARGRVALYLVITMAPFAVVAPVIGPVLDRFRHGRRWALAITLLGRAGLAFGLARAIQTANPFALYPAAFGVLVLSKAYGVSRSAVLPRLLPPDVTLVQANARLSLAGLVPAAVAAPIAAGVTAISSPPWTLRLAALVYVAAGILALRLPKHVDSDQGERPLARTHELPLLRRLRALPATVARMLRSAGALRALSGFLVIFVAFLIRSGHLHGVGHNTALGLLATAVAAGGLVGTFLGARVSGVAPETLSLVALAGTTALCLWTAYDFGLLSVLLLAVGASAGQSLTKLALDAVIQRDVEESVRTSTFARTETVLQLAWVAGGGLGLALIVRGTIGFALVAGLLVVAFVAAVRRPPHDVGRSREMEPRTPVS